MAVEAGLDVLPAIASAVENDGRSTSDAPSSCSDPVTALLRRSLALSESGMSIEDALRESAASSSSVGLRHAFLHLGLAQREGGELARPLHELSDAAQTFFQETVEETIAKLPVKATLPLLLTFTGLILLFLAAPLVQVVDLTTRAMPQSRQGVP